MSCSLWPTSFSPGRAAGLTAASPAYHRTSLNLACLSTFPCQTRLRSLKFKVRRALRVWQPKPSFQYGQQSSLTLHPWSPSTEGVGSKLYWNLSLWSEYNIMLMETDLSKL